MCNFLSGDARRHEFESRRVHLIINQSITFIMSLDLYLVTKTPIKHRGTGVYVREDGQTKELETVEEVKQHFPDADLSGIHEYEYEDNKYYHNNITHNLNHMAAEVRVNEEISLYKLLWYPNNWGFDYPSIEYKTYLKECLEYLEVHPEELKEYNPENGWGNYEQLVEFTRSYYNAIERIPEDKLEEYEIVASI